MFNINNTMSDSDYDDSDYDEDTTNDIYEPEEQSLTRFNITICELYNKRIHGSCNSEVKYHYLVNLRYKTLNMEIINNIIECMLYDYVYLFNLNNKSHDIFRNYKNMITNEKYIKPEITECIYLDTGHCVGIKKTIWIKLIQRTWKNIYKKRELIIKKRCHSNSLSYRDLTGKWPNDCINYPGLKGMLSCLKV